MKTPYKIAKEIGVSPQAVYKRLSPELVNQLSNHIQRGKKGQYLLDDDAERVLINLFNRVDQPVEQLIGQPTMQPEEAVDQPLNNQKLLDLLQQQLEVKDRQIKELQNSNRELVVALENTTASLRAAQALHAGTINKQIQEKKPEKPVPAQSSTEPADISHTGQGQRVTASQEPKKKPDQVKREPLAAVQAPTKARRPAPPPKTPKRKGFFAWMNRGSKR